MKLSVIALAAALLSGTALAQAQVPTYGRNDTNIQQRKFDQQRRIRQGVRSGELTRRETAHLERQERGINREERFMRARDGGRLTHYDRRVIHYQQNRESRRIYRDRHNARRY